VVRFLAGAGYFYPHCLQTGPEDIKLAPGTLLSRVQWLGLETHHLSPFSAGGNNAWSLLSACLVPLTACVGSLLSSIELKNEWSRTSTVPYALMVCVVSPVYSAKVKDEWSYTVTPALGLMTRVGAPYYSAAIKNDWSYTSISTHAFMACVGLLLSSAERTSECRGRSAPPCTIMVCTWTPLPV
jgi:hypothetical protein